MVTISLRRHYSADCLAARQNQSHIAFCHIPRYFGTAMTCKAFCLLMPLYASGNYFCKEKKAYACRYPQPKKCQIFLEINQTRWAVPLLTRIYLWQAPLLCKGCPIEYTICTTGYSCTVFCLDQPADRPANLSRDCICIKAILHWGQNQCT